MPDSAISLIFFFYFRHMPLCLGFHYALYIDNTTVAEMMCCVLQELPKYVLKFLRHIYQHTNSRDRENCRPNIALHAN